VNIIEKMKHDWDQRAQHHARFWIATENYQTEELFAQSGLDTAHALLQALTGLQYTSWKVLDIGCGIGRTLKPLAKHFHALVGIDVSSAMITQSKSWLSGCHNIETFETSGVDLRKFNDQSFDLV
jgi:ubiquinone/menaquinone biosynthesis C-methylase UbiE